ncbi:MAG: hypothetical protein PHD30_09120 [Paludibacter sp.]|nr:hypothetical protein [Paludibacter sp.]
MPIILTGRIPDRPVVKFSVVADCLFKKIEELQFKELQPGEKNRKQQE